MKQQFGGDGYSVDIAIIALQLGHRSIITTARHLDRIAPPAVIETVRSQSWAGA